MDSEDSGTEDDYRKKIDQQLKEARWNKLDIAEGTGYKESPSLP